MYFCTRFRKGNHLKSRIRLVVQDNCLSRSRSPVRLWYAVRKNDNMQCICRFFCTCVRLFAFFCYLCNLNFKLIVMHKCLLFLVFALMTCFAANAAPVSAEAAGCRAAAFLHRDAGQLQLLKSPYEYLYLFAFEEGGFAVVSADDRVPPILGYSDKGVLTVDDMPPALAAHACGMAGAGCPERP